MWCAMRTKIDILRVTCTDDVETVLGITEDELLASDVSPAAEDCVSSPTAACGATSVASRRTILWASRASRYELVYPASLEIALDQGFIFQPFERPFGIRRAFTNRATAHLMNRMDGHLRAWVDERTEASGGADTCIVGATRSACPRRLRNRLPSPWKRLYP